MAGYNSPLLDTQQQRKRQQQNKKGVVKYAVAIWVAIALISNLIGMLDRSGSTGGYASDCAARDVNITKLGEYHGAQAAEEGMVWYQALITVENGSEERLDVYSDTVSFYFENSDNSWEEAVHDPDFSWDALYEGYGRVVPAHRTGDLRYFFQLPEDCGLLQVESMLGDSASWEISL